jgi:L-alanine-DL-glutamate epimerase-like enolase superfamily enzyme
MSRMRADAVAAIETTRVTRTFNRALAIRGSRATHDVSEFLLVRVATTSGATGYGEVSATPYWSGEDASSAEHFIRDVLRPALVGQPIEPISTLSERMDRVLARNEFTKAGLNIALWDTLGKLRGQPVAALLGGPFRNRVLTKISLSGDGSDLEACVDAARARGFSAFKVKVGIDLESDIERVTLARELVGAEAILGIDANGGWTQEAAQEALQRLVAQQLAFVEQPVAPDDFDGMRRTRKFGVPIVADEAVYGIADIRRVAAAGACDAVSVYMGKSGGLDRAAEALTLVAKLGLAGIVGSNGELGIGAAAQIHVACASESLGRFPHDIAGHHYYDDEDIVSNPVEIDGTTALLPRGPGLGVTLDPAIERTFA